jgi:hypothetical protein
MVLVPLTDPGFRSTVLFQVMISDECFEQFDGFHCFRVPSQAGPRWTLDAGFAGKNNVFCSFRGLSWALLGPPWLSWTLLGSPGLSIWGGVYGRSGFASMLSLAALLLEDLFFLCFE